MRVAIRLEAIADAILSGEHAQARQIAYRANRGNRIEPTEKNQVAICPGCLRPVRSKCGDVKLWHWSHMDLGECGKYWEPMTVWHVGWQNEVPIECREVYFPGGRHRADILTKSGCVVEIQHSPVSREVIQEREAFYGERMIWIFDAREPYEDGRMEFSDMSGTRLLANKKVVIDNTLKKLTWKPRCERSIEVCERRRFLDLDGETLFWIKNFHKPEWIQRENEPGYLTKRYWSGVFISREDMVRELNK